MDKREHTLDKQMQYFLSDNDIPTSHSFKYVIYARSAPPWSVYLNNIGFSNTSTSKSTNTYMKMSFFPVLPNSNFSCN